MILYYTIYYILYYTYYTNTIILILYYTNVRRHAAPPAAPNLTARCAVDEAADGKGGRRRSFCSFCGRSCRKEDQARPWRSTPRCLRSVLSANGQPRNCVQRGTQPQAGQDPATSTFNQKCTSKGMGRQGVVLKQRNSYKNRAYALSSYALTYAALIRSVAKDESGARSSSPPTLPSCYKY